MPKRSSVSQLPKEVKEWLDKALVDGNFSGYEALSEALAEKGFTVSKSAIHRYGQEFENALDCLKVATDQAKAIAESCPDDAGAMNDALIRLVQQKAFQVLMKLEEPGKELIGLGKMVGGISRVSVSVKKYMAEVRSKIEAKFKTLEADGVAGKRRIDPETLRQVREEIYGVV